VAGLTPERAEPTTPGAVVDVLGHEPGGKTRRQRDGRGERAQQLGLQARQDEFDLRRRSQRRHHGRWRLRSSTFERYLRGAAISR
jgi:hypothetical protein